MIVKFIRVVYSICIFSKKFKVISH